MTLRPWHFLALAVFLLTLISFIWLFQEEKTTPGLGSIPFIFWSSFVVTLFVVLATFLGSKIFPHKETRKS
ncbi:MAG: hypothetical protein ACK4SF_16605 [Algoriphagus aquaeductus]|uniref:hypothetical protein n=1 Tax=Algoriphagus aquaeductus TaxID=475299 RepID=UPI00391CB4D3